MISILIPVYNFNVIQLVSDLSSQLSKISVPSEIIVADDLSALDFKENNRIIADLPKVEYIELDSNIGRSKIRNFLADKAKFQYLLFVDCDAGILNDDFVEKYIRFVEDNCRKDKNFAVLGGIAYRNREYFDKNFRLRYNYGIKRETAPANSRNLNPYKSFTPFNLLISKSVFDDCRFDEFLNQYGYEDTFFGLKLQELNIPVYHIDNQLFHDGIDSNADFVNKVKSSCENLAIFYKNGQLSDEFISNSKLLSVYFKYSSSKIGKLILRIISKCENIFRFCAIKFSSVRALDFYKLSVICEMF